MRKTLIRRGFADLGAVSGLTHIRILMPLLNINKFLLDFTGDLRVPCADVDVYFGANSKFGEIDAGLNGEAGAGDDPAHVVSLEVVHVRAVAMYFFTNRMAGAMHEKFAITLIGDEASRGIDQALVEYDEEEAQRAREESASMRGKMRRFGLARKTEH